MSHDKIVDRIAKFLAVAGNEGATDAERERAMERATYLSQLHSLDLSIARAHQAKKEKVEEPERRQYKVGMTGRDRGSRITWHGRNAHFVDLYIAIAEANDLKVLISQNNVYCWGLGFPSDHDVVEKMFAVLSLQMVQEADAELKRGANRERKPAPKQVWVDIPEDERAWGQPDNSGKGGESHIYDERDEDYHEGSDGKKLRYRFVQTGGDYGDGYYSWVPAKPPPKQKLMTVLDDEGNPVMEEKNVLTKSADVWRENFYRGFVSRVAIMQREAKAKALKDAGFDPDDLESEKGLALVDKKERLAAAEGEDDFYVLANTRMERGASGYQGGSTRDYDHGARAAGDAAGQRAATGFGKAVDR